MRASSCRDPHYGAALTPAPQFICAKVINRFGKLQGVPHKQLCPSRGGGGGVRFAPHKLTNCQLWHGKRGGGFSTFPTTLQGSPKPPPVHVQCLSCRGRRQGAAGCTAGQTWRAPGRAQATPCPSDVPLPLPVAQSLLGLPDLQAPPRTCLGPG